MRLFIAEKPSAASDLAKVLGIVNRGDGYFECGQDVVTFCVGHLLESAAPEDYDPALKQWTMSSLPIVPGEWKSVVKSETKKQLSTLGRLIKSADSIVNFGDADNEGQLLVDEVLEHFNYRKPVSRLWLQALDPEAIRKGLANLEDNKKYCGRRDAARARGRADWLVGMNFSRLFTLLHQVEGGKGVISIGRVQTPTLALVQARCDAVANFKPIPFHSLRAKVKCANGEVVMAWKAGEGQGGLDAEGRLVDTALADALLSKLRGATGDFAQCETKPRTEGHPGAFSLTSITKLASKMFGYKPAQVLEICQSLYEKYKLTSYPRVDNEYLPESQHQEAPAILAAIAENVPAMAAAVQQTDAAIKSKTWDDKQITAHHGIIPRPVRVAVSSLPQPEANVYQLIVRAYIAQFFPLHKFDETKLLAKINGEDFTASGRVVTEEGWKVLYRNSSKDDEAEDDVSLPVVVQGEAAGILSIERLDKKTKSPTLLTEGQLPEAMENIHRNLEDQDAKQALKEAEGIGTNATRAAIIEELKRRGFLVDQGKFIVISEAGRKLLATVPSNLKDLELAASWETKLRAIERGELNMDAFVASQAQYVAKEIASFRAAMPVLPVHECPTCGEGQLRRIPHQGKFFWGCSRFAAGCKRTFPDASGVPQIPTTAGVSK